MALAVLTVFGDVPDDPEELARAFAEAEWVEQWRAGLLAHEVIARLFGR